MSSRSRSSTRKPERASGSATVAPRARKATSSPAAAELDELETVFAALAHASRRHILLVVLFRGGNMTAGEIADRFACTWPTTTRHLRQLEDAGLLQVEKRGRARHYHLDRERLQRVVGGWLRWFDAEAAAAHAAATAAGTPDSAPAVASRRKRPPRRRS